MFGRKKPETPEDQPEKTPLMEVRTSTKEKSNEEEPKLSKEEKKLKDSIDSFKQKYGGLYSAHDFLSVNQAFVEAEKLNLNYAMYSEIVGLREDIKLLTKALELDKNN